MRTMSALESPLCVCEAEMHTIENVTRQCPVVENSIRDEIMTIISKYTTL